MVFADPAQGPAELADQDRQLGGAAASDRPHAGNGKYAVGLAFYRHEECRAEVAAQQTAVGVLSQDQVRR